MARASVELIVEAAKAVNPLRAVNAASKKAEAAIDKLKKAVQRTGPAFERMRAKAESALKKIQQKAKQATASFKGFGKAAAIAAGSAAALAGLKFAFSQAGELERQTKSLQVLTNSLDKAKEIIGELQAFGAVTPFTSQELIETAKRLKAFGFETEQVVDVTKRLADVAGATGADLGGIATAFGQIQAKGRLQGEELLQLQERGVALQDELRKMYGLTGEEFSKALSKGQIGAESVEAALIRLTEKGGKYANGAIAQSDTLFGKLSTLQDAISRLGQNIGKALSPVFKGIIDFLTTITNQINNLFGQAARASAIDVQARKNLGLPAAGGGRLTGQERARLRGEKSRLRESGFGKAVTAPTAPVVQIPELLRGNAAAATGKRKSGKDPAKIAADIAKASAERVRSLKQQTLLAAALTNEEQRQFEQQIQIADILENAKGLTDDQLKAELAATIALHEQQNATAAINAANAQRKKDEDELAKKAKAAAKAAAEAAAELDQMYSSIGQSISTGIVDALSSAVDGTKKLADVASNVLQNIANILLQFGVSTALGGIPGLDKFFGGKRANGGTVGGGRSYLVGEKGPELFTPGRTGSIAPSGSFGETNVVVNVDASGSQAQGNQPNAKALGSAIGAAVQAELIKQKRPGGLLA